MATRRHIVLGSLAAALLSASGGRSSAAGYPERPIRIVVPFPPGGNADFSARLIAPSMSQALGQPVVIDNRTGAGGIVGTEAVARAEPDGYTLLLGTSGPLTLLPVTTSNLPYDPVRDLAPIGISYRVPICLMVSARLPVRNLEEFVAYARAHQGRVNVGSSGIGSGAHLAIEMMSAASKTGLTHVPYRGTGPAINDLIAGTIPAVCDQLSNALPLHADGRARILGVGSAERSPVLPDVPTFRESGLVQAELSTTIGLLAPARTPAAAVEAVRAALATVMSEATIRQRLVGLGAEVPQASQITPARYADVIRDEIETSRQAVSLPGVKLE